ncbi:ATP-binding protein [Ascidiimonas sp. W6]|uniref:GAF domain-containing sensor histidine kinase n=1 Tax=Ascidiimonas meishanensis TaxID=3128903 RepID=UPI0030EC3B41
MKVEATNHIATVLQLYEFSMAIGKSLSYKENCDFFLKQLLARKNLSACWIYADQNGECIVPYSLPVPDRNVDKVIDKAFLKELFSKQKPVSYKIDQTLISIAPSAVERGCVAVFYMGNQGLLFLHSSEKTEFTSSELAQLEPIIAKFAISLEACSTYERQQDLLINLEKQNQELNNYAHMVSHDLKSPLRNINALTYWLKEDYGGELPSDAQNNLSLIGDNLEKMDLLIQGILIYTKIDKIKEAKKKVGIQALLKEVLSTLDIPSNIKIESSSELPVILGHKYALEQLFSHLISNAINAIDKPSGCITINYKDTGTYHKFVMSDNGQGIREKYLKRVFDIFQKLDSSGTSSGIGLAIVKKIIKTYNGDVYIESIPEKGTNVVFTLKKEI